jgi:serine/threonine protein phosphatase 1
VVIEIETERGKVGIVHADVPRAMSWGEFKSLVEKRDQGTLEIALWGRDRLLLQDSQVVKGVDRIFVGHSIQWSGGTRLGNIYYIDSGAVFKEIEGGRGYLTIANIACRSTELAVGKATGQKRGVFPDSVGGSFSDYSKNG